MDDILAEIYSTIIPSAPYIIAAYVLIMVVLFIFIALTFKRVKRAEDQLSLLEDIHGTQSDQQ